MPFYYTRQHTCRPALFVCRCLLLAIMLLVPLVATANDPARLPLKGDHQLQVAGNNAANENGRYPQAALNAATLPGVPGDAPIKQVVQADFREKTLHFWEHAKPSSLELKWLYGVLVALVVLVLIPTVTAIKFFRLSSRLKYTIEENKRAHEALKESHRQLESLSITDGLTGLANRRRFDTVLTQEHGRHARSETVLSLIMIDIDHFKAYNDCYGHVSGDDCLRQVAQVIAGCIVRAADFTARYGGEEFVCVLPDTESPGAMAIADKIRLGIMALALPHCASPTAQCVTASFGVVSIRCTTQETASDILVLADAMLYKAKANGRNRIEVDASRAGHKYPATYMAGNLVQLVWKDAFRTGNHQIDTQHQHLFLMANKLLEAILSARPHNEIATLGMQLLADVAQHFHDEEAILARVNFPGLQHHAEEHARLHTTGQELAQALAAESAAVGDVFKFLVYDMVLQHMIVADREFFPFVGDAQE